MCTPCVKQRSYGKDDRGTPNVYLYFAMRQGKIMGESTTMQLTINYGQ